jgi:hypothetical protein
MMCVPTAVDNAKVNIRVLADLYDVWNESKPTYITFAELIEDNRSLEANPDLVPFFRKAYNLVPMPRSAYISTTVLGSIITSLSADM